MECIGLVELLLQHGADVNTSDKDGRTALHAAAEKGYVKTVETLLECNADVNSTIESREAHANAETETGFTALHAATEKDHLAVVEVLLKFGASIDSKDEYGRTALHVACRGGDEQIVTALLEHGSDINIMTKDNSTPIDIAEDGIHAYDMMVASYDSADDDYYCLGRDLFTCESIAVILQHHMVKMKTAHLYVSDRNLWSISDDNEIISDFQNECEEEIARLKGEKVGNANVSFYDILTKGTNQLAMYAGNESIVQVLKSDDYKRIFPIYASMINCNFRKGERRKELLEQGNKVFHFLFNNFPQLPHDCTDKVFSYLSDEDLRNFIHASKPVSNQNS
jgi:hypothetical protein